MNLHMPRGRSLAAAVFVGVAGFQKHLHHVLVRAAVQRTLEGGDGGGHCRVDVRQRRGRHPTGERAGVQAVFGLYHGGGIHPADDRFVLCGPADEITVRFDAKGLPDLPPGWVRSYTLRTHGYCKDTSSTTVTGSQVRPAPFRRVPNSPPFGPRMEPRPGVQADLLVKDALKGPIEKLSRFTLGAA